MSDEEENIEEGEEGEDEVEVEADDQEPEEPEEAEVEPEEPEPEPQKIETKPRRPPTRDTDEDSGDTMTEAEKAMLAAKRKHEEEQENKIRDYEEQRRIEREQLDEELAALREKQLRRKEERVEEERLMAERKQQQDERKKQEDEERKHEAEEKKRLKQEEKMKRLQMMAGALGAAPPKEAEGRNFTLEKKESQSEPSKKSKQFEEAKAKADFEQARAAFVASFSKPDFSRMQANDLKDKIKNMHERITKLEALKYDLEKRGEAQAYDLRELAERQRQANRNKAIAKGLDPDEVANSQHPPKIAASSKYDRQTDRRSYGERRNIYAKSKKNPIHGIFHGSARPPVDWGRPAMSNEELEMVRKNLDAPKYVENDPVEGAKPPMQPVPVSMPPPDEKDEDAMKRAQTAPAAEADEPVAEDEE